jgi:hypothetical protein
MPVIHPDFYFYSYIQPRDPQGRLRSIKPLNRTVSCELIGRFISSCPSLSRDTIQPHNVPGRDIQRLLALSYHLRSCFGGINGFLVFWARLNFEGGTKEKLSRDPSIRIHPHAGPRPNVPSDCTFCKAVHRCVRSFTLWTDVSLLETDAQILQSNYFSVYAYITQRSGVISDLTHVTRDAIRLTAHIFLRQHSDLSVQARLLVLSQ